MIVLSMIAEIGAACHQQCARRGIQNPIFCVHVMRKLRHQWCCHVGRSRVQEPGVTNVGASLLTSSKPVLSILGYI